MLKETITVEKGYCIDATLDSFTFADGRMLKGVKNYVIRDIKDNMLIIDVYYEYESSVTAEFELQYKKIKAVMED
ncbi:MAG: hypothetical protein J6Z11_12545 [Candidatus Riflebacteria bacterium]|nr:hypothetical protein [Candidatus Riflebacteria bacterium]